MLISDQYEETMLDTGIAKLDLFFWPLKLKLTRSNPSIRTMLDHLPLLQQLVTSDPIFNFDSCIDINKYKLITMLILLGYRVFLNTWI